MRRLRNIGNTSEVEYTLRKAGETDETKRT